jgi:O-antigen/teichoic acid export membrane protein
MISTVKNFYFRFQPAFIKNLSLRIQSSPIGKRLAKGFFWSFVGSLTLRFLQLISGIIVARILGKEVYGELGIVNSTTGMLGPIAGLMMGLSCTKYIAQYRDNDPVKVGNILAFTGVCVWVTSGLVAIGLFIAAPWVASSILSAPMLTETLRLSSLVILFGALSGVQNGALMGFEAFKEIARINIISGLATFPIVITGGYFYGLNGIILGTFASSFLNWLLNFRALKILIFQNNIILNYKNCWHEKKIIWSFSLPSMLASMVSGIVTWGCYALLVNRPNGYAEMGVFNVANQWQGPVLFLFSSLAAIVLPVLSGVNEPHQVATYKKVLYTNLKISGYFSLIIATIIALSAPWILKMYGNDFQEGIWIFVIIVMTSPIIAMHQIQIQAIVSKGKMWPQLGLYIIWSCTTLGLSAFLIPSYGAMGLALSFAGGWAFFVISQAIYLSKQDLSDTPIPIG